MDILQEAVVRRWVPTKEREREEETEISWCCQLFTEDEIWQCAVCNQVIERFENKRRNIEPKYTYVHSPGLSIESSRLVFHYYSCCICGLIDLCLWFTKLGHKIWPNFSNLLKIVAMSRGFFSSYSNTEEIMNNRNTFLQWKMKTICKKFVVLFILYVFFSFSCL